MHICVLLLSFEEEKSIIHREWSEIKLGMN